MVRPVVRIAKTRIRGFDAFRGVAVLCMVVVHTARVTLGSVNDSPFRAWLTLFEPAVSAAFLWLVGWSLHQSYADRANEQRGTSQTGTVWRGWYRRCLLRAATLYAVGMLLFLLQYGVQSPDGWASPDILSAIAWAILLVGVLLPFGTWGLLGGAVAVLGVLALVGSGGVEVSGVNVGPGATVPLVAIACVGACQGLSADGLTQNDPRARGSTHAVWALGGAFCSLVALGLPGELVDQHASPYAGGTVWFWNHTLRGVALYGGAVVAVAAVFGQTWRSSQASPWWRTWAAPLLLLGRHALLTYVGHLLVLGAVDRWLPLQHPHRPTFVVLVLALPGAFVGIAMVVESKHARHLQRGLRHHLGLGRNTRS